MYGPQCNTLIRLLTFYALTPQKGLLFLIVLVHFFKQNINNLFDIHCYKHLLLKKAFSFWYWYTLSRKTIRNTKHIWNSNCYSFHMLRYISSSNIFCQKLCTTLLCRINTETQSAWVLTWSYLIMRPPKCFSDNATLPCVKLGSGDGSGF